MRTPDKIARLTGGADDYLTKPFAMNELLARVNALGRRFAVPPSRVLRAGDVTLNVETREVARGNRRIELSERDCALLKVLMREPGRASSRMELSERVWERAHGYDTKLIAIYIGRLRKKIDEGSTQPLIKTVRHLGYAVCGDSSALDTIAPSLDQFPQVELGRAQGQDDNRSCSVRCFSQMQTRLQYLLAGRIRVATASDKAEIARAPYQRPICAKQRSVAQPA